MTLKEVIHDKFSDGIMSAIDFTMDVQKGKIMMTIVLLLRWMENFYLIKIDEYMIFS